MELRLMKHSNQFVGETETLRADQMIWRMLKKSERRGLGKIFALMLIGTVLEMFSLGLVVPIVGLLVNPDYIQRVPIVHSLFGDLSTTQYVLGAMGLLVGVFFLKTIFLIWKTWVQRGFSNAVTVRIAQDLFKNYLMQPYPFHLERNSAIMIRNSQSSAGLMSGVIDPLLLITSEFLVSGGLFILMVLLEPVGSLSAIVVFGSFSIIFRRITSRRIAKWGKAQNDYKGSMIRHLQQGFSGVKDIKILGREDYFIAGYNSDLSGNAYVQRRYAVAQTLPRFSMELLTLICLALLVSLMVLSSKAVGDILPVLSLFGAAAFRLLPSLSQVINSFMSININRPTVENLYVDLALPIPATTTDQNGKKLEDSIDVEGLSFSYARTTRDALNDVSISVRRGEAVGLIGSSGSGKSTLVDILLGLLEPTSGNVLVDGHDIQENLREWQDQIGYVPQSIFLTDDTLRRNIAFGLPKEKIDDDAVKSAIRLAQLEEFVASLPDGMETLVGERGVRLSGGQRQRIGIARALYNNPDILVLDEATSSLDTETEHGVMQAVQALQGDKTVIIVAHRLSTVEYCDRLYRLENAQIVDEGTFSEVTSRTKDLLRDSDPK
jgi:ABC-type multidrug transport system fused ATPase/permease subunit